MIKHVVEDVLTSTFIDRQTSYKTVIWFFGPAPLPLLDENFNGTHLLRISMSLFHELTNLIF